MYFVFAVLRGTEELSGKKSTGQEIRVRNIGIKKYKKTEK